MDFSEALHHLIAGAKLANDDWNGKGMFVVVMPELKLPPHSSQEPGAKVNDRTAKYIGEDTPLDCQPYFAMYTPDGKWQPGWVPSTKDLFGNNWRIV